MENIAGLCLGLIFDFKTSAGIEMASLNPDCNGTASLELIQIGQAARNQRKSRPGAAKTLPHQADLRDMIKLQLIDGCGGQSDLHGTSQSDPESTTC